jgi:hypothetical protein
MGYSATSYRPLDEPSPEAAADMHLDYQPLVLPSDRRGEPSNAYDSQGRYDPPPPPPPPLAGQYSTAWDQNRLWFSRPLSLILVYLVILSWAIYLPPNVVAWTCIHLYITAVTMDSEDLCAVNYSQSCLFYAKTAFEYHDWKSTTLSISMPFCFGYFSVVIMMVPSNIPPFHNPPSFGFQYLLIYGLHAACIRAYSHCRMAPSNNNSNGLPPSWSS